MDKEVRQMTKLLLTAIVCCMVIAPMIGCVDKLFAKTVEEDASESYNIALPVVEVCNSAASKMEEAKIQVEEEAKKIIEEKEAAEREAAAKAEAERKAKEEAEKKAKEEKKRKEAEKKAAAEKKSSEKSNSEKKSSSKESASKSSSGWNGQVLTARLGVVQGPSGKETYYNLKMSGVVKIMRDMGYDEANYPYWVRDDGVKMFGKYVMCAANLDVHPRGSLVESSLGTAIVCDTGTFAKDNPYQLDIAVNW